MGFKPTTFAILEQCLTNQTTEIAQLEAVRCFSSSEDCVYDLQSNFASYSNFLHPNVSCHLHQYTVALIYPVSFSCVRRVILCLIPNFCIRSVLTLKLVHSTCTYVASIYPVSFSFFFFLTINSILQILDITKYCNLVTNSTQGQQYCASKLTIGTRPEMQVLSQDLHLRHAQL